MSARKVIVRALPFGRFRLAIGRLVWWLARPGYVEWKHQAEDAGVRELWQDELTQAEARFNLPPSVGSAAGDRASLGAKITQLRERLASSVRYEAGGRSQ